MKKHIILYGAYDRYNFGDNLMPIIFKMYIEKYHTDLLQRFTLKYCSIGESDLSQYACFPTESINKTLTSSPSGSLLIIIGGEVLCASNLTLLMHIQKSELAYKIIDVARFFMRRYLTYFTRPFYGTKWEFPYIPPKISFKNNIKIAYNTIGGGISTLNKKNKAEVINRLISADYISVRDKRTLQDINGNVDNIVVYPDSVHLIGELIDDDFLKERTNKNLLLELEQKYFCFQASPHKVGLNIKELATSLISLSEKRNEKIILLPIGYASGHDDLSYMKDLLKYLPPETALFDTLNVWEIMQVIKKSSLFIGTSLHGIITAMAFGRPHFGLNPGIGKVHHFLKNWSIEPFNKSYKINEIISLASEDLSQYNSQLLSNSKTNSQLVKENNENIIKLIK